MQSRRRLSRGALTSDRGLGRPRHSLLCPLDLGNPVRYLFSRLTLRRGGGSEPHLEPGLWLRVRGSLRSSAWSGRSASPALRVHGRLSVSSGHTWAALGTRTSLSLPCCSGWAGQFPRLNHRKTGLQRAESVGLCACFAQLLGIKIGYLKSYLKD